MSAESSHPNLSQRAPAREAAAGDPGRGIGARVRIDGVVVGREKYGVSIRLSNGTIQCFSERVVSPAEPESPGDFN